MRFELSFLERAYFANLLRIRASTQRGIAQERSASAVRVELEAEAAWCEEQACELDRAEEPAGVNTREPIRVDARRDIDAVDAKPSIAAAVVEQS